MRVKGFPVDQNIYEHSGVLHEIRQPSSNFELFDPASIQGSSLDDVTYQIEDILLSGAAAVFSEYSKDLARYQSHEVFPDKIIEERRSAHGVSFGRFVLRQATGVPRDRRNKLSVAMKPFMSPEHAARECAGYLLLAQHGIETFSPVGIFQAKSADNLIVVTEKRNDLVSLDRDIWAEGLQVQSEEDIETLDRNTRTVREIAQLLGYIHALGFFHPDGQIKNWAVDQTGTIGIIDTENMEQRPLHHSDTAELAASDIDKLLKSLVSGQRENKIFGVGLLSGLSDAIVRSYVEKNIIDPYIDVLISMSVDASIDDLQAELLIKGITDHTNRDGQLWPNYLSNDN